MLLWFIDEMNPNHQRKIGWVVICPGALGSCYTPYFSTCCCEQTLCGWSSIWGCWPSMQCGSMIQTWFAGRPSIRSSKSDRFCKDSLKSNRCAHSCPEKNNNIQNWCHVSSSHGQKNLDTERCDVPQKMDADWSRMWGADPRFIKIIGKSLGLLIQYTYAYTYTSIHLYIYTYMHTYTHIYIYIDCINMYRCIYVYVYDYTFAYVYTSTFMVQLSPA